MNRRLKTIGAVLALIAMLLFIAYWPISIWLWKSAVSEEIHARTKALVDKNPHLQPEWEKAVEDGVLTQSEVDAILAKAGEKPEPND